MAFSPGMAISQVTSCFTVILATVLGFFLFNKTSWCNNTLGKVTKSSCDTAKRAMFAALGALIVLSFISGMGGGGYGGYGGGGGYF